MSVDCADVGGLEQILSESGTARLEVASARLADGTLLQVGKSSENREALLARYRTVLAIIVARDCFRRPWRVARSSPARRCSLSAN